MKAALIIATALAVASADVSHLGYNYKVPQTSYGIPSYQIKSGSQYSPSYTTGYNLKGSQGQYLGSTYSQGSSFPSHTGVKHFGDALSSSSNVHSGVNNFVPIFGSSLRSGVNSGLSSGLSGGVSSGLSGGVSSGLSSGLANGLNSGFTTGLRSGLVNGYTSGINNGQYYQTVGQSQVQPIYLGSPNQYQYASAEKYQQYVQVQQQPAQVYKHFYVHAAPEEPEEPRPRTPIVLPPPQKHYKIIFVKTPNVASRNSQIVQVQPQNEEKTIVYVLVKKPEEQQEVIVPKVEQKPPTKPEVYFIKYNNKDDQTVINNIVNDYNKPGQTVTYSTGDESDGIPSSSSGGVSYSNLPTVTSFSNFPSSVSYDEAPAGLSFSGPSVAGPSVASYSTGPSVSGFSTGPSVTSFSTVPSGSSFSSVPSGSSFSSGPIETTFSGVSSPSFTYSSGVQNEPVSVSGQSFGTQTFGSVAPISVSSGDSGVSASIPESNLVSGSVTSTPVVVSTTPSFIQSDLNTISTSQGVPHETYGTPKFRAN